MATPEIEKQIKDLEDRQRVLLEQVKREQAEKKAKAAGVEAYSQKMRDELEAAQRATQEA